MRLEALSVLCGLGLSACSDDNDAVALSVDESAGFSQRLSLDSVKGARLDAAVVPEGYEAQVLAPPRGAPSQ